MVIVTGTLAVTWFFAYLARRLSRENDLEPWCLQPNTFLCVLIILIFTIIGGARSSIGDTYEYMYYFKYFVGTDPSTIFQNKEFGFSLYQVLLKNISADPQILIIVSAVIIYVLIINTLRKYANPLDLAIFLFVAEGTFVSTMNGIRQYIAAAILFAACRYIFEGKWQKYFILVLVAATFHTSALIMIPFYFIVRRPAWSRSTLLVIFTAIFAVLLLNFYLPEFLNFLDQTPYANYSSGWFYSVDSGANPVRVAVVAVPVLLAFIGRKRLRELGMFGNVIVNMSVLTLAIYIVAMFNWIFARFAYYTGLYNLLLLPFLLRYTFSRKDTKVLYLLGIILYLLYFYYETTVAMHLEYNSIVFGIGETIFNSPW